VAKTEAHLFPSIVSAGDQDPTTVDRRHGSDEHPQSH
jgi:hypothetical protein